jgi:hypothetical protein
MTTAQTLRKKMEDLDTEVREAINIIVKAIGHIEVNLIIEDQPDGGRWTVTDAYWSGIFEQAVLRKQLQYSDRMDAKPEAHILHRVMNDTDIDTEVYIDILSSLEDAISRKQQP